MGGKQNNNIEKKKEGVGKISEIFFFFQIKKNEKEMLLVKSECDMYYFVGSSQRSHSCQKTGIPEGLVCK